MKTGEYYFYNHSTKKSIHKILEIKPDSFVKTISVTLDGSVTISGLVEKKDLKQRINDKEAKRLICERIMDRALKNVSKFNIDDEEVKRFICAKIMGKAVGDMEELGLEIDFE